jgi:hypothetical protein
VSATADGEKPTSYALFALAASSSRICFFGAIAR